MLFNIEELQHTIISKFNQHWRAPTYHDIKVLFNIEERLHLQWENNFMKNSVYPEDLNVQNILGMILNYFRWWGSRESEGTPFVNTTPGPTLIRSGSHYLGPIYWSNKTFWKLLVFDGNPWNYIVCKLLVLDWNTWNYINLYELFILMIVRLNHIIASRKN